MRLIKGYRIIVTKDPGYGVFDGGWDWVLLSIDGDLVLDEGFGKSKRIAKNLALESARKIKLLR